MLLNGERASKADLAGYSAELEGRWVLMEQWILYPVLVPPQPASRSGAPGNESRPYFASGTLSIVACPRSISQH